MKAKAVGHNRAFSELQQDISACTQCVSFTGFGYWKFPASLHGNPNSPVWIVGADPRRINIALAQGQEPRYWMGASRRNLRDPIEGRYERQLEDLVYLTDAVKCQRPSKTLPSEASGKCPPTWLAREISLLRPTGILALGDDASRALAGCSQQVRECGASVIELPHPSPANGASISAKYGKSGWPAYHSELLRILGRFLDR
jgi:uracil-DNA glycosylase